MREKPTLTRRRFVGSATLATGISIVPRHVLGGALFVAPSERINLAYIGCGTQGLRQLMPALENPDINVVAVCDPNRMSDDYPQWGPNELNDKIRKFIDDPQWAKGARGGLCGREVGRHVVNRCYARQKRSGESSDCRAYADFRELLDKEKQIDAVYIMTPDHLHGTIAVRAMRLGKHVIVHKPLANALAEARLVRDTARQAKVATHMFCAADRPSTATISEWLAAGAIGAVREVHNWSSRPFWPQGMTRLPQESVPVPDGLDWDLWLGPAQDRPYHPSYTHAVFRGWVDFGSGALGDMGHYSFYQIWRMFKLAAPAAVSASRSQYWSITDFQWRKETSHVAFPQASSIVWEFAARGDQPALTLHWYDGGLRPPIPDELKADGEQMPAEGMLLIGEKGKLLAGFSGEGPRLIPKARMADFRPPPQTLPRPIPELDQWIRACRGGPPSEASFESVYPFAETIQLGNVALRTDKRLLWDTERMAITNAPEMQQWLHRKYRTGWEL